MPTRLVAPSRAVAIARTARVACAQSECDDGSTACADRSIHLSLPLYLSYRYRGPHIYTYARLLGANRSKYLVVVRKVIWLSEHTQHLVRVRPRAGARARARGRARARVGQGRCRARVRARVSALELAVTRWILNAELALAAGGGCQLERARLVLVRRGGLHLVLPHLG